MGMAKLLGYPDLGGTEDVKVSATISWQEAQKSYEDMLVRMEMEHAPDDYLGRVRFGQEILGYGVFTFSLRQRLVRQFAFAIPSDEALEALSKLGPIIEMGAGTGYWAHMLRKRCVNVLAYDRHPPGSRRNFHFPSRWQWTGVLRGRPRKLRKHADHALFLCWPNYNTDFASQCLANYAGDTVAYIGEGDGGCTGDDAFFDALSTGWTVERVVTLPQWPGVHDSLVIYRRKQSR